MKNVRLSQPRDRVSAAIQDAANQAIVPRFRALREGEVHQKGANDVVTIADHECEHQLTASLAEIAPDVPLLGEEASAANPALHDQLAKAPTLWVVDPLDGTRAFVNGNPDFAVMVAYLVDGVTQQAWIWQPTTEAMFYAERGVGAYHNGLPIPKLGALDEPTRQQRGIVKTGFMPPHVRARVLRACGSFAAVSPGPASAGFAYPQLASGEADFALFWRTLPWDHAAGTLLTQEVGCYAARPDGTHFDPFSEGDGLLIARDQLTWGKIRDELVDPP